MFTNSIAVAEITGIIASLENIPKNHGNKIAIFCDNKYVVGVANDLHQCHKNHLSLSKQLHSLMLTIRQTASVTIEWIPAHCDIELHDEADTLAVEAALLGIDTV